jgi:hypothetical protein
MEARQEEVWQNEVDLLHLAPQERETVLRMLEPHQKTWDGHLGTVSAISHRIAVTPGSKPVHSQPCRAGSLARAAENAEIDRMLKQVIEPATGE